MSGCSAKVQLTGVLGVDPLLKIFANTVPNNAV